jgi:hypothetical protein
MIIEFFRSSSFNNWDYCQQQYYLNYVLGIPRGESKKALKGTIAHKVLECLASAKQKLDLHPSAAYITLREDIGEIIVQRSSFLTKKILTQDEIYAINRTRTNKYTYLHKADLPPNSYRLGVDLVEELITKAYEAYHVKCDNWQPVDLKDIRNFVWMTLEFKNGMFDPRMRKIVAPEQPFAFEIKEDWAKIDYVHPQTGEKRDGYLGLKGTMDLITEIAPDVYEIVDWKTGQRKDWASGAKKDFTKLSKDFQLKLYHYAASKVFPNAKQILVSIFFSRDGGPYTLYFDENSIKETEEILKQRFEEIKASTLPKMCDPTQRDFKCNKICDYYNMASPDGKEKNFCKYAHSYIKLHGIEKATKDLTHHAHDINHYAAPGDLE